MNHFSTPSPALRGKGWGRGSRNESVPWKCPLPAPPDPPPQSGRGDENWIDCWRTSPYLLSLLEPPPSPHRDKTELRHGLLHRCALALLRRSLAGIVGRRRFRRGAIRGLHSEPRQEQPERTDP